MGAAILPIAMAAGTMLSAVGKIKEGNASYKAGMEDAATQEENARLAELDGALSGAAIRHDERQVEGEQIASQGMSGLQLGTGSPLEALRESAHNAEMDVLQARYSAGTQARSYRIDAARARSAAKSARRAGFLSAATGILKGISDFGASQSLATAGASERAAGSPYSGLSMPVPAIGR